MPAVECNRIVSRLYQGSRPPLGPWVRHAGFDTLVLAAEEYQPRAAGFPGVRVAHVPLDDADPSAQEKQAIRLAGRLVASEVSRGRRVLVTCMQGRNRSGIIVAAALCELYGAPAQEVIWHIRRKRPVGALSNPFFVEALRSGELCPRHDGPSAVFSR